MKSAAIIFRLLVVCASCTFFSGAALTSAKEVEIREGADPVIKVEYEVAPESISSTEVDGSKAAGVAAVKSKVASPVKKGLVYLPLISLSSYFPVVAQIILMILVISLSGLFGAWLMFRFLANKILAIEERTSPTETVKPAAFTAPLSVASVAQAAIPVSVPASVAQTVVQKEDLPLVLRGERAGSQMKRRIVLASDTSPIEVKKKSRKEKKKVQKRHNPSGKFGDSSGVLVKVGDRLVLKRPGESQSATSHRKNAADTTRKNRMPQSFLINEWFPMDQQ